MNHTWKTGYSIAYDGGKMDAFRQSNLETCGRMAAIHTSTRIPRRSSPTGTLASEYALAEHLFTTQGSGSFIAHQDLIRGGTIVRTGQGDGRRPDMRRLLVGMPTPLRERKRT